MFNNRAIVWKSRHQPIVVLLTIELEYMALTDVTKELKWVKTLIAELGYNNGNSKSNDSMDLFSDN